MESGRKPGDYILDRYFKGADEETRKHALDAFIEFARVLLALGEEVARREGTTDSHDIEIRDKIRSRSSHDP